MGKIIAVDVDGVLCNMLPVWLELYNHDYADNLTILDILDWDLAQFVKKSCGKGVYEYLADHRLYTQANPFPGVVDWVVKAREVGHRIIYVTAVVPGTAGIKRGWLLRNGFPVDDRDYFECFDKNLIVADWLIDDAWTNCINWAATGRRAFLIYAPHNWRPIPPRLADLVTRVNSIGDVPIEQV